MEVQGFGLYKGSGFWRLWVQGLGFWVSGFRVWRFRVLDYIRVQGFGGFGFRVWGFGFRV